MTRARDLADQADGIIVGDLNVDGGTIKLDGNYPVGTDNVALGDTALDSLTSGTSNVAIGSGALTAGTEADRNVAIGASALSTATTGVRNVAIGHIAGAGLTTGSYNTALGAYSLISNTTADNNTAVGYQAGYTNITGTANCYIGGIAGQAATGSYNTFIGGYGAGYTITSGAKNTIIGNYSGNNSGLDIRTSDNNIVLSDGDGNPWGYRSGVDGNWFFDQPNNGEYGLRVRVTNAGSSPYGLAIQYPNTSPNNTAARFITCTDSSINKMIVYNNGDVANTNNSYGAISDVKLKENIVDAASQWDDIKNLTVRKYSLKADSLDAPNMLGVIAQEVEAAGMGGLVYESPDQDAEMNDLGTVTKQVNYSILYMKAVKALQEAMTRIETLEAKVTALEGN